MRTDEGPAYLLMEKEFRDWLAVLSPRQRSVVAAMYELADLHGIEFAEQFLDHEVPLTVSQGGRGREQLVEVLRGYFAPRHNTDRVLITEPANGTPRDNGKEARQRGF